VKNMSKLRNRSDRARLTTSLDPLETLRQHVYFTPYPEEDVHAVLEYLSEDRLIFGSDFPHVEGCSTPSSFFEDLDDLSDGTLRRVARDNTLALLSP
jgi:predicted TIM-barrel fold metal-dependent hydrolase